MCKDLSNCVHDRVSGKEAVQLLEAIKSGTRRVCTRRRSYLESRAGQFRAWMIKEVDEAAYEEFVWGIKEFLHDLWYGEEGVVRQDLIDIWEGRDDLELRLDGEEEMYLVYHWELWSNARRGTSKYWQGWRITRLSWFKDAIERENRIADHLNKLHLYWVQSNKRLPRAVWRHVVKCRDRISELRRDNLLTHTQFCVLTNWCNELAGSPVRFEKYNKDEELEALVEEIENEVYEQDSYYTSQEDNLQDKALAAVESSL